jgi:hypothetical protein
MNSAPCYRVLRLIANSLDPMLRAPRSGFRFARYLLFFVAALQTFGAPKLASAQGLIFVTDLSSKISGSGGCSLPEAIYSANFDSNIAVQGYDLHSNPIYITTNCLPGNGADRIILPTQAVFTFSEVVFDVANAFGPTATPMVASSITIEANGSTLEWTGFNSSSVRAFAVGSTGSLTLRDVYIRNFHVRGGNGANGGGGGLGAGGAIYVKGSGSLAVERSTFSGNSVRGGDGGSSARGGGGGGLGGDGGFSSGNSDITAGGGGGSWGHGGNSNGHAASGGGTVFAGNDFASGQDPWISAKGGFACGGDSGRVGGDDGQDAPCPGGGGGGGGSGFILAGNGGKGNYGGGGGGGGRTGDGDTANGGNGGFGGGGGAGQGDVNGGCGNASSGGDGGFGGGGGAGPGGQLFGGPGHGGTYGGDGSCQYGGGGGALGGAVFSDGGNILVENSTFTGNSVRHGLGGGFNTAFPAVDGGDAGSAIFAIRGSVTIRNSTVSGNQSTSPGGAIVVSSMDNFALFNTIISDNGVPIDPECLVGGTNLTGSGNLITSNNSDCPGILTRDNPQLGPLQLISPGLVPTMAIPKTSPAFNAAEPISSLTIDQRGFPRPQENGFDIGAFELCIPQGLIGLNCQIPPEIKDTPPTKVPFTIQVSPAGAGTTNPAVGTYSEDLNSVVLVSAAANPGFGFVNWTGGVADPTNPSTAVIIDQPKTITANFLPLSATIAGNIVAKMGASNARVWTLSLLNNGPGLAAGVKINDFTLTQTFGAACTPILTNAAAFPLSLGNLLPSQTGTTTVTLNFTGCAASARFTAKFTFSANNGAVSGFVTRTNQYQ